MYQIAESAGVSIGTVSNVINGSNSVREQLRQRVLGAIQKLGYQPNQLSRGLRLNRTNIIGVIVPDITNPFFPSVVRGVEDIAFEQGYRLILCNTDDDPQKEFSYVNDLRSFLPAGLLVIPAVDSTIKPISGIPMVCLDRIPEGWRGDAVVVANYNGAYDAARHVIRLGHRQIAVISGPSHLTNARERLEGFLSALREAKIPIDREYMQEGHFDQASGHACMTRLLRMLPRPTAVFAANDLMGLGALSAVREAKLACPDDVSIISFDGLEITEVSNPALTTVSQSGYQLGRTAARLLLNRIGGSKEPFRKIVLPTELKIRNSVMGLKSNPRPGKPAPRIRRGRANRKRELRS
jgi:DNA-binding LacI/PurR family transcriptional regulator